MYLFKPKAKQQSDPVDFTFYPTGGQEGKMFPPAAPPTHGSPVKSAPKRGRDRAAKNEDEPSSGGTKRDQGGMGSSLSFYYSRFAVEPTFPIHNKIVIT